MPAGRYIGQIKRTLRRDETPILRSEPLFHRLDLRRVAQRFIVDARAAHCDVDLWNRSARAMSASAAPINTSWAPASSAKLWSSERAIA